MKKSLIEDWLPVRELSRDAAIEMSYKPIPAYIKHCKELGIGQNVGRNFYDPKIRNLHPWFARRPCSVARAITLAAVLPNTLDKTFFMKSIGWERKPKVFISERYPPLIFYTDPDKSLIHELSSTLLDRTPDNIIVCDPMAGGGTIPLESLRLGFRTLGVEYNPLAFLILKGTVEYPSKYGEKLAEYVREEGKKLISYARDELGKFYPNDSRGYIIARGIKCPKCRGQIPLVHETWLGKSYYLQLKFDTANKTFAASITNYPTILPREFNKKGQISCPYCGEDITKKHAYELWTAGHVAVLNDLRKGLVDSERILSAHALFIKQTKKGYEISDGTDISYFLKACKELANYLKVAERYLPSSEIPPQNEVFAPLLAYGIKHWYELFNPRQLLSLLKLIKYVHDRCQVLTSTKGELGAAISLYLALGISRVMDYNSIVTTWKKGTIRDTIGGYAQNRTISYREEYCEAIIPYRNLDWIFEPDSFKPQRTQGGICPILSELCKQLKDSSDKVTLVHGDCRYLSSIFSDIRVDVVNVDPPYFDSQIYSDISEFFWQVFPITLRPLIEDGVLFKDSKLTDWKPTLPFVPREGEIIARKRANSIGKESDDNIVIRKIARFSKDWYTHQMSIFFRECFKILNENGIILTWFTHRSLEAWEALISSLYAGGFYVSKIWPITTELLTRLVSKGNGSVFNKTLIIVSRKREKRELPEKELKECLTGLMQDLSNTLAGSSASEREFSTFLYASAMCAMTRVEPPEGVSAIEYFKSKLIPLSKKLADEVFTVLYEQFRLKRPSTTLESFL